MNIIIKLWVSWIVDFIKNLYLRAKAAILKNEVEELRRETNEQINHSNALYTDFMRELSEYKSANQPTPSGDDSNSDNSTSTKK